MDFFLAFRFLDLVGIRVAEVGYRDLLRFEVVVAIHDDTIVSRSSFASPFFQKDATVVMMVVYTTICLWPPPLL